MSDKISKDKLKKEIHEILDSADLSTTSAKKVRQQLEEKLDCDLTSRKKEIDGLVMDYVNSKKGSDDEDESEEEESEPETKSKKRASSAKKPAPKRKKDSSDESPSADEGSDDDYKPGGGKGSAKKGKKKAAAASDSDSDEDWKQERKPKAKKGEGSKPAGGAKKGTGFTRPYTLSPELAELMGETEMARHEVVKKVWAMIKEKNLYDPKNKQYAICDEKLHKVIGVKRFRTFGMMKYLMPHFIK